MLNMKKKFKCQTETVTVAIQLFTVNNIVFQIFQVFTYYQIFIQFFVVQRSLLNIVLMKKTQVREGFTKKCVFYLFVEFSVDI